MFIKVQILRNNLGASPYPKHKLTRYGVLIFVIKVNRLRQWVNGNISCHFVDRPAPIHSSQTKKKKNTNKKSLALANNETMMKSID